MPRAPARSAAPSPGSPRPVRRVPTVPPWNGSGAERGRSRCVDRLSAQPMPRMATRSVSGRNALPRPAGREVPEGRRRDAEPRSTRASTVAGDHRREHHAHHPARPLAAEPAAHGPARAGPRGGRRARSSPSSRPPRARVPATTASVGGPERRHRPEREDPGLGVDELERRGRRSPSGRARSPRSSDPERQRSATRATAGRPIRRPSSRPPSAGHGRDQCRRSPPPTTSAIAPIPIAVPSDVRHRPPEAECRARRPEQDVVGAGRDRAHEREADERERAAPCAGTLRRPGRSRSCTILPDGRCARRASTDPGLEAAGRGDPRGPPRARSRTTPTRPTPTTSGRCSSSTRARSATTSMARAHGAEPSMVSVLPPHVVHDGRPATAGGFRKRVALPGDRVLGEALIGAGGRPPGHPRRRPAPRGSRRSTTRSPVPTTPSRPRRGSPSSPTGSARSLGEPAGRSAAAAGTADLAEHLRAYLDAQLFEPVTIGAAARDSASARRTAAGPSSTRSGSRPTPTCSAGAWRRPATGSSTAPRWPRSRRRSASPTRPT